MAGLNELSGGSSLPTTEARGKASLFSLPRELRNTIYAYLFSNISLQFRQRSFLISLSLGSSEDDTMHNRFPEWVFTSRQILAEATDEFYYQAHARLISQDSLDLKREVDHALAKHICFANCTIHHGLLEGGSIPNATLDANRIINFDAEFSSVLDRKIIRKGTEEEDLEEHFPLIALESLAFNEAYGAMFDPERVTWELLHLLPENNIRYINIRVYLPYDTWRWYCKDEPWFFDKGLTRAGWACRFPELERMRGKRPLARVRVSTACPIIDIHYRGMGVRYQASNPLLTICAIVLPMVQRELVQVAKALTKKEDEEHDWSIREYWRHTKLGRLEWEAEVERAPNGHRGAANDESETDYELQLSGLRYWVANTKYGLEYMELENEVHEDGKTVVTWKKMRESKHFMADTITVEFA